MEGPEARGLKQPHGGQAADGRQALPPTPLSQWPWGQGSSPQRSPEPLGPAPSTAQNNSLEATCPSAGPPALTQPSAALPVSTAVLGQVPALDKVPRGTKVTAQQ